ncbi:MAG: helix-turn-helix domain-containing protein [Alphaproteobacteria bacterium]
MEAVRKALWYIESRYADGIDLHDIARASGLSRFHLARSFAMVTGRPVSSYLRARRLSEAARLLAEGRQGVLPVALAVGYGSHEGFTRAFRTFFGFTPEQVRKARSVQSLKLVEPFPMSDLPAPRLQDPRFREEGPLLLAGIREFRTPEQRAGIPDQWRRLNGMCPVPGQTADKGYGLCFTAEEEQNGFDYMAAVPVSRADEIPPGLSVVRIPRQHYAVFSHDDHVATIAATCAAIFSDWLPGSGKRVAPGPVAVIEHYPESFNPKTGRGGIELWVPLAP